MPYTWVNGKTNRYRDDTTGKFASRATVVSYTETSLQNSKYAVDNLVSYYSSGALAQKDFERLFWGEIRDEYIRQYMSGVGGKQMMGQADYSSIGGMLKEQKKYFDRFMGELPDLSEAQIRQRAEMYIASAREAHERARTKSARKWGADEVKWNLGATENHCTDCPGWAAMGWQPMGKNGGFPITAKDEAWPGSGSSQCLTNCRCSLGFRSSQSGKQYQG